MLADHTELFKQFSENPGFKKWLSDTIFGATYESITLHPDTASKGVT
jgi:type I restriction enzyme R subunit